MKAHPIDWLEDRVYSMRRFLALRSVRKWKTERSYRGSGK